MGKYIIRGGRQLSGQIKISGAKNAALPIAAATLLTKGAVIYNCPDLTDIRVCLDILEGLGCKCSFRSNVMTVEPFGLSRCEISKELCGKMRSSVTFVGALLGEMGRAEVYCPGGCALGSRPIDMHLEALSLMGCVISQEGNKIICSGFPKGAEIALKYPSVGATENIILAAAKAKGTTLIKNAAREPEITALSEFLNRAGAKIKGAGTANITIEGAKALGRCEYTVPGDRIEAGTYLCAAAVTGGELFLSGIDSGSLKTVVKLTEAMGCIIKESSLNGGLIYVDAPSVLSPIKHLKTAPYPGFPTDMQAPLTAALCLAEGESTVTERVFDARNKHIPRLNEMGADITLSRDGRSFFIKGVPALRGCRVKAEDLRGGAALIIAALAARGETTVENAAYIQRGYEDISAKLGGVGAEIEFYS